MKNAKKPAAMHWHAMQPQDVAAHWHVDPRRGLAEDEAARRLAAWGPNRPTAIRGPSALERLLSQIVQPLVLVLVVAGFACPHIEVDVTQGLHGRVRIAVGLRQCADA